MLGSGFSQNIAALIICRFFAGMFCCARCQRGCCDHHRLYKEPEASHGPGSVLHDTIHWSAIGPLIGAFAVENKGWRWTAWVTLMFSAAVHPMAFYLRESYKSIILQSKAQALGLEGPDGPQRPVSETIKAFVRSTIVRPLHMLFTEPLVGYICLYTGFQFALLYTFVVASPWVFETVYGFSVSAQGLSFLGLVTGCCIAPAFIIAIDRFLYQPRLAAIRNHPTLPKDAQASLQRCGSSDRSTAHLSFRLASSGSPSALRQESIGSSQLRLKL